MSKISVAFFHLSFEKTSGGVERYGRILEAEAGGGFAPVSYPVAIRSGEKAPVPTSCAGLPLVFQYSPIHYAAETLEYVQRSLEANPGSRAIVIVHDANAWPLTPRAMIRTGLLRNPMAALTALRRWRVAPNHLTRPKLDFARTTFVVFSEGQRERLPESVRKRTICVPHFVEANRYQVDRAAARAKLGFDGKTVLSILGYVNPRKNPELALRVLAKLPANHVLVLAGGALPRMPEYPGKLDGLARELGVAERFFQTGFLPDDQQAEYMAATDIGLCLFHSMSASGSLSSWISAGVPVLVSKLDEFRIYERLAPRAFLTTTSVEPCEVAKCIMEIKPDELRAAHSATEVLRGKLRVANVVEALVSSERDFAPS